MPVGEFGGHIDRKPQHAGCGDLDLLHEDGSTMVTWRQSYYLTESDDGPKAIVSASHAG